MTTSGDDTAPPPDPPEPPGPPESPPPAEPPPTPPGRRGLTRSTDRYAGGVAGGIAQALDVDPIVVRLALVVGTFYLPAIVVAYALAWLVLPDERTGATLLGSARGPDGWRPVVGVVGLGVGVALLAPDLGPGGNGALTFGTLLAGIGVLLVLRQPGVTPRPASPWPDPPEPPVGSTWEDPPTPPAAPPLERLVRQRFDRTRRRRPPSPLGWLGLSALVVLVGVLAAVDRAVEPVSPGIAVSLGLLLVGVVLVAAAWRGRARVLILPGLALLPLWIAFALSDVPHYENDGDAQYNARTREELRSSYEHGYGQMDVNLAEAAFRPGEHRDLRIGLTAGQARLYVPPSVHLVIRGHVGAGAVDVIENPYFGVVDGNSGVGFDVDLRVGDPRPTCTEQPVYAPPTTDGFGGYGYADGPPELIGTETVTPWGDPCEPEPPVDDPAVLEVTLDVGVGSVEVRRETT